MINLNTHQADILNEFIQYGISKTMLTRGKAILQRVISITKEHDDRIVAEVKGSESGSYTVVLEIDEVEEEIEPDCTCYYYQENYESCKHIAAVALSCKNSTTEAPKSLKEAAIEKLIQLGLVSKASSVPKPIDPKRPMLGMDFSISLLPDYWGLPLMSEKVQRVRSIYNYKREYNIPFLMKVNVLTCLIIVAINTVLFIKKIKRII